MSEDSRPEEDRRLAAFLHAELARRQLARPEEVRRRRAALGGRLRGDEGAGADYRGDREEVREGGAGGGGAPLGGDGQEGGGGEVGEGARGNETGGEERLTAATQRNAEQRHAQGKDFDDRKTRPVRFCHQARP